ncbi:MAG TPA: aminoacetone oxidase family FAD-binding enzyme, partial [Chitinophagaceae bacterium]|nr:aminoacetone oxidase family FAD-binding enzyme [Chitinophagaceae bacterium]
TADYLCIATGGYPRHTQFDWITALGHSVEEPVPSLFTFNLPGNNITALMGISVEKAKVKIPGTKLEEEGPLLITHWGMSGPAVLKLSAWGARVLKGKGWHFPLQVNWTPDYHEQQLVALFQQWRYDIAAQKTGNKNSLGLPNRLWEYLLHYSDINPGKRWADLSAKEQNRLAKNLSQYPAEVKGKTTFKEEFVTAGGIRLSEVDPQTMMSKKVNRLFFAGEVLDVDGVTGGFNFQHAWTTGFIAAKNIAELAANE